jgi:hypothetical protein
MIDWNSPVVANASEEQKWDFLRLHRNKLLVESDYTQLTDTQTDKAAWAIYRQALRDLPAQGGSAEDAEFPTAP